MGATTAPLAARSVKPVAAAMMLFFASMLGLWMGSVLAFEDDVFTTGLQTYDETGNFTGRVTDGAGDPLAGVIVVVFPGNGTMEQLDQTQTDADGLYYFPALAPDVYLFRFSLENYTTVLLEAPAYPDQFTALFGPASPLGSVAMEAGDSAVVKDLSSVERFNSIATGWGWFTLVAAVLAIAGGVAALMRKMLPLAIIGCVAGMATIGFLVGAAVSLIALVLIVLSRKEFPARTKTNKSMGA